MGTGASDLFDLLIVGAGPAGCSAAIAAAARGLRVALVDAAEFPRSRSCAGWIGPAGVELCERLGVAARKVGAVRFRGLHLHSWDFKRSSTVDEPELSGWIVPRASFDQHLLAAARTAGATLRAPATVGALRIGEDGVEARLDPADSLRARILLIADGARSRTAAMANLLPAGQSFDAATCLFIEAPAAAKADRLDVVLGSGRPTHLATLVQTAQTLRLSLLSRAAPAEAATAFEALCRSAVAAGLLPGGMTFSPERLISPAGVGLGMDTHVGKRCLLIGDAGGFVTAFSNEGIYPAMRSGEIAAEVAASAVAARVPQDELARFDGAWRSGLAEYLRMPNTDLSLLLPLVFGNEQMARRVARAFLLGRAF